jgi:hypothetical protein
MVYNTERLAQLPRTTDNTTHRLTEDGMALTDEEMYEGFTKEQIERYKREVRERYDPRLVQESERRVRNMSKAQWKTLKEEGEQVTRAIAEVMDKGPDDPKVQALIARHHGMIEQFYACSAEMYRGLGRLYVTHDEFRAYYERFGAGLADFMQTAMAHYADHVLAQGQ